MRWSQTLIPTSKETPADAQIVSHQLLVRGGFIRQLTAGVYDFLPLGLRSLRKAEKIVREEMNTIGCAELLLPALQPLELWQQTGRDKSYGENLFRLTDRHGRKLVLGPTHEEVITELIRAHVSSYKQLPVSLYQIQTKFRDEYRPRFGLLRVREFLMKDAYSFHANAESLRATYDAMYAAYERIFQRCGVPFIPVEAESGPIGGSASHEFLVPAASGEDTIVTSDKGNYAANLERAETGTRPWTFGGEPTGALEKIHTPNLPGVDQVCEHLKIKPKNMLKTLVFRTNFTGVTLENVANPKWLVAVVRGDHDVNEAKLARAAREHFHIDSIHMEDTPQVRQRWAIGYCGPDEAVKDLATVVIVDPDAAQGGFWATGGNEPDHHVKHFNWFRECGDRLADPRMVAVADIRNVIEGDPSPRNDGGVLHLRKGIELGHVFQLGTKYSDALGATFDDEHGQSKPILMGCYGIGIGRILVAAVESSHDERGIIWPKSLAPFSCVITPVQYTGETKAVADRLYEQLNAAGIDTLLDDRDARPGFKFADADLIGIPIRLTIGERGLKEGKVELKRRTAEKPDVVALDQVLSAVSSP
jgi:prolyl-tRNA synthetase